MFFFVIYRSGLEIFYSFIKNFFLYQGRHPHNHKLISTLLKRESYIKLKGLKKPLTKNKGFIPPNLKWRCNFGLAFHLVPGLNTGCCFYIDKISDNINLSFDCKGFYNAQYCTQAVIWYKCFKSPANPYGVLLFLGKTRCYEYIVYFDWGVTHPVNDRCVGKYG